MSAQLPACMMPDGAEPFEMFQELQAEVERLRAMQEPDECLAAYERGVAVERERCAQHLQKAFAGVMLADALSGRFEQALTEIRRGEP